MKDYDIYLTWPPGKNESEKKIYDEKLFHLNNALDMFLYPNLIETSIYENKKSLAFFLTINNIPHPATAVFCDYSEAVEFLNKSQLPIVAKTSIGAAGSGVKILKSKKEVKSYLKAAFKGDGIKRRSGPNRVTGSPYTWASKAIKNPKYFFDRLKVYKKIGHMTQHGYVIFQEYIEHTYEWRMVKVGESFFAHKKIKVGDMASGGGKKEFGFPPKEILDFVDQICNRLSLDCVCFDVFESPRGYLVNEIQCVFGIPYGYLSKVDDKVGRFIRRDNDWIFEEGDYTSNQACDLKLSVALSLLNEKKTNIS